MKLMLLFFCTVLSATTFAQKTDNTEPPYRRFPTLPPIQLLLSDSSTKFTKENFAKKKQVLVMLFSPECEHCQHETEELLKNKDEFKDIQIVMATNFPLWEMNDFVKKYKVKELPDVVVGRDFYYLLPTFYSVHNFPFLALYDKKGNLIDVLEGSYPVKTVLETFKNSQK